MSLPSGESAAEIRTPSGIPVRRVYGPKGTGDGLTPDTRGAAYEVGRLGRAGEPPYTRGVQKTMYRGRLWTMRQYAGFGTAAQTNARFRWLLEQGQTGLSTAFDLPTQMGLDADHPRAKGEVGRVGVHVGTSVDMEALLEGIPLGSVSTSLTINATAPVLLAFYVALAKRRGVPFSDLRGTLQNDVLKEYLARGTYIYPVEPALRFCVDAAAYAVRHLPKFNPISISGYHIREAGADAVQEVAFTFANARAYVGALLERGLSADELGPRLAFFFGCHSHFLEEIAKFRAARRVWRRMMEEEFGAKDPSSWKLRFHVQTCGSTLTSRQPLNNVARVSMQALAAVLGGCQSLHTNSYDEALGLPSEEAAQLALRTQQVLALETGVADTVDPVAGAYAIEALTDELEERILAALARLGGGGGMLAAIADGSAQAQIQDSAYRAQQEIESGRRKIVGVNCYPLSERGARRVKTLKISPALESAQRRRLAAFRKGRSGAEFKAALRGLETAARRSGEPLFEKTLACVEAGATLGEICDALRSVWGEFGGA